MVKKWVEQCRIMSLKESNHGRTGSNDGSNGLEGDHLVYRTESNHLSNCSNKESDRVESWVNL